MLKAASDTPGFRDGKLSSHSFVVWFQRVLVGAVVALVPTLPTAVAADDASLYDAPLPDDAAYLRFLGFPADAETKAFGLVFSDDRITSQKYNVLRSDVINGIEAGQIFTAIPDEKGAAFLIEEAARVPRKITLQLVNLSDMGPLSLTTADGSVEIIAPTEPSQIGSREVNPIRVSVVVNGAEGTVGDPIELSLRPNQHTTFVVLQDGAVQVIGNEAIPEAIP